MALFRYNFNQFLTWKMSSCAEKKNKLPRDFAFHHIFLFSLFKCFFLNLHHRPFPAGEHRIDWETVEAEEGREWWLGFATDENRKSWTLQCSYFKRLKRAHYQQLVLTSQAKPKCTTEENPLLTSFKGNKKKSKQSNW